MDWWHREAPRDWDCQLRGEDRVADLALRRCTHAGRPFGSESFVNELAEHFGRRWVMGRPKVQSAPEAVVQPALN